LAVEGAGRHGVVVGLAERRLAEVLVGELHALHVLLLLDQHVAVLHELLDGHLGLVERRRPLPGVDEPLGDVLDADLADPLAHLVVVHPRPQCAEEVDGLPREGVHQPHHGLVGDVVGAEDALAHADAVLPGGRPVELLHAAVPDEGRVQRREVVAGDDDGHAWVLLLVVHPRELHVGGRVRDVHQGGVHHLVVHRVLRRPAHPPRAGVQVVDEEAAHLALLDNVGSLAVPLPDQLGRLAGVAALQLSGAHHDGVDAHLGEHQLALERLALSLASPDTQDERDLDVGECHEVLGEVDDELVHERRGDVQPVHGVVEVVLAQALADVLVGAQDSLVGAVAHGGLEQGVHDAFPPRDVLLVIGDVVSETLPPIGIGLLALVKFLFGRHGPDHPTVDLVATMVVVQRTGLLLHLLPEEGGRGRRLHKYNIAVSPNQ
uniref:Uncharacterized protein n=1 Tax=Triticum urartu TaxID=4572 RepID=A0A8R7U5A8_TRIUA